jgi:hypothetical protein
MNTATPKTTAVGYHSLRSPPVIEFNTPAAVILPSYNQHLLQILYRKYPNYLCSNYTGMTLHNCMLDCLQVGYA